MNPHIHVTKAKWLQASHAGLKRKSPLELILAGEAETVARMLESARGGSLD